MFKIKLYHHAPRLEQRGPKACCFSTMAIKFVSPTLILSQIKDLRLFLTSDDQLIRKKGKSRDFYAH